MNFKQKGTVAERELVKLFWENSWACIRSAGSGSMQYPSPDILAGNKLRRVAIESKVCSGTNKYFDKEEIRQLRAFCDYFGAESWIAVKFKGYSWNFFNLEDLKETSKGFSINVKDCDLKGIKTDEFFDY